MNDMQIDWIGTILMGGMAGWLSGKFMNMPHGIFMNIIIGIIGAVIGNAVLHNVLMMNMGPGWLSYFIVAFIGASLLLFVVKLVRS